MKSLPFALMLALLSFVACDNTPEPEPEPEKEPFIRIVGGTVPEGNGSPDATIRFVVSLSGTFSEPVSVEYKTVDGSAKAGEDYTNASGVLTIAAGQLEGSFEITVLGDEVREADETFEVHLENPVNGEIFTAIGYGNITNDDTGVNFGGATSPTSYAGYSAVWGDEFDGTALNEADWTYEIGTGGNGWGNNELQYYRRENTKVADGNLVIEAKRESFAGSQYTSSRLVTLDKQSFQFGRIDIRAVLPQGQGIWPALWMLGSNFKTAGWPDCGEIDIMEMVGGGGKENTVHGTVHWDNNGSYANYGGSTTKTSGTFSDQYHVFSILWDEDYIRWLVDNVEYHVIDIRPSALSEFRQPFFFIFNVAVGGNWPGSPDATTSFPQQMIVDYVRVFKKD